MAIIWKNGKAYREVKALEIIDEPSASVKERVCRFRQGQRERRNGRGCVIVDGDYIEGWHAPDKAVPPMVTGAQVEAFNL